MDKTRPHKRSTIHDVARLAGLSVATVSRYMNGTATVSDEKASRISAAIHELDYLPRSAAQDLARNATKTIGLLLPTISGSFFAPLLRGVERGATEEGFSLLVHSTQIQSKGLIKKGLAEHNTDGLLVFAASLDTAELTRLHFIDFPVVLLHQTSPTGLEIPYVTVENRKGVRALMDHLIEVHNLRRIAHLRGPAGHEDTYWREQGYQEALQVHNIPFDPALVEIGGFNTELSRVAMRNILEKNLPLDAVFAGDDESASGAMMELRLSGFRVPEDIAVVGFDDLELAVHLTPALTTVHSPIEQVAYQAVQQLVRLIRTGEADAATLLPTHIVIRQSCGCVLDQKQLYLNQKV